MLTWSASAGARGRHRTPTRWPSSGPDSQQLLTSGQLSPPEPEVYPLDEAAAAVASLENRTAKGKVVLRVR